MREYKLMQGQIELTNIFANNETEAWSKIKKMGFRNRSKIFNLVCDEDDI